MAMFDMIAKHKQGLLNSTVGNGLRGGVLGAGATGIGLAIGVALTGPIGISVAGAMAVGGLAVGGVMAAAGFARWAKETATGITGSNRGGMIGRPVDKLLGRDGPEQEKAQSHQRSESKEQSSGLGLGELAGGLVAAVLTGTSAKKFLADKFGFSDKTQDQSNDYGERGDSSRSARPPKDDPTASLQANNGNRPSIPKVLQNSIKVDDKGVLSFEIPKEDLARKDVQKALKNFGDQMNKHANKLGGSGDLAKIREGSAMLDAATKHKIGAERDGRVLVQPEQLMNQDNRRELAAIGKEQKGVAIRAEAEQAAAVSRAESEFHKRRMSKARETAQNVVGGESGDKGIFGGGSDVPTDRGTATPQSSGKHADKPTGATIINEQAAKKAAMLAKKASRAQDAHGKTTGDTVNASPPPSTPPVNGGQSTRQPGGRHV
ncbi:MAG: hypothetical protein MK052_09850 [Alphaproteobacteria bacterium]|nr:hypothetical protein [Alphaproteobacteria bacterium]